MTDSFEQFSRANWMFSVHEFDLLLQKIKFVDLLSQKLKFRSPFIKIETRPASKVQSHLISEPNPHWTGAKKSAETPSHSWNQDTKFPLENRRFFWNFSPCKPFGADVHWARKKIWLEIRSLSWIFVHFSFFSISLSLGIFKKIKTQAFFIRNFATEGAFCSESHNRLSFWWKFHDFPSKKIGKHVLMIL